MNISTHKAHEAEGTYSLIIKNFATFLYLVFERREMVLYEYWRDYNIVCTSCYRSVWFVYICLYTVTVPDICQRCKYTTSVDIQKRAIKNCSLM